MNFQFQNVMGAPYRGGSLIIHGSELLSPIGNRVSQIDLTQSTAAALPYEHGRQVRTLCLSPDGRILVSIDVEGRAVVANRRRRVELHRISFREPVRCAAFSPDGRWLAVATGRLVQVWRRPSLAKSVAPLALHRTYGHASSTVCSLDWSPCSTWLAAGSEDLAIRIMSLHGLEGYRVPTLLGHKTATVAVQFAGQAQRRAGTLLGQPEPRLWTLSRDGALLTWTYVKNDDQTTSKTGQHNIEVETEMHGGDKDNQAPLQQTEEFFGGHWKLTSRYYFNQRGGATVTAAAFHPEAGLLAAGFSNGVFDLLQLPDAVVLQSLSVGSTPVSALAFNPGGDWLAVGSAAAGSLLVWEWKAETYALKQQGHAGETGALAYSPDGAMLATAGDDASVKVWTPSTGTCFVTLRGHAAPVTSLAWLPTGAGLVSASLDGTVRAHDLVRYRCFRTLVGPGDDGAAPAAAAQYASVAVDPAGEIVAAGRRDGFEIHVWSLRTGRLLDVLSAHEGPVVALAFAAGAPLLASGSWDRTVRTWDVFSGKGATESLVHAHDVLALAWSPGSRQLAASTLDGGITLWDAQDAVVEGTIYGRRDVAAGRSAHDRRAAETTSQGRAFTSLAYSADGELLLAAGDSKWVCVYDVAERVLLRRYATTIDAGLDGVRDMLNSRNMTDAGPLDQIDDAPDEDDALLPRRLTGPGDDLPGVARRGPPPARVRCLALSPTGRAWAASTTTGVVLYSAEGGAAGAAFDPTDLDEDVTPAAALGALRAGAWLRGLLLALRLGDAGLAAHVLSSTPPHAVGRVARLLPAAQAPAALRALCPLLGGSPHLELALAWLRGLCAAHGSALTTTAGPALRDAQRALTTLQGDLASLATGNLHALEYLAQSGAVARKRKAAAEADATSQPAVDELEE